MAQQPNQRLIALTLLTCISSCSAGNDQSKVIAQSSISNVSHQQVFSKIKLNQPLALLQAPKLSDRWYVVEKPGRIIYFDNNADVSTSSVYIDITENVDDKSEGGLLGAAFHPDFANNKYVYLSYTTIKPDDSFKSIISRFVANDNNSAVDPRSELILLSQPQPYSNHNGGNIAFGPDGYLYIGFGDGGSGGDPQNNAQNTTNLLGAMLRIDVNVDAQDTAKKITYKIPPTNPFANSKACGKKQNCPEIYAWGLRNPWRWSFDKKTGELWAGDVGQNEWEEIDKIELGKNYGWRCFEGAHIFNTDQCDGSTEFTRPIAEYAQNGNSRSITGGYIYRGAQITQLIGSYIYADFVSGDIFALTNLSGKAKVQLLMKSGLPISSFGQSNKGEIYFLSLYGPSAIYRLNSTPR